MLLGYAYLSSCQTTVNQDSVLQLIQNEKVDSSKLKLIISAIKTFDFDDKSEVEFLLAKGIGTTKKQNQADQLGELYSAAGLTFIKLNDIEAARIQFNKLLVLASQLNSIKYQAMAKYGMAMAFASERNAEKQKELLEEVLILLEGSEENVIIGKALLNLAGIERQSGNYEDALKLLDNSEKYTLGKAGSKDYLMSLNSRGRVYRALGKYDSARLTYARLIDIALKDKEDESLAKAYNNLGNIDQLTGNIEGALSYYVKSLKIKEKLGNERGIALAHHNIGSIKANMKLYPDAIENFRKSQKLALKIEYPKLIRLCELKIGSGFHEMNQIDSALYYHLNSLRMAEESKDKNGVALCYLNLGEDYVKLKDFGKGLKYFSDALLIARETKNVSYQSGALTYIATTYLQLKDINSDKSSSSLESLELTDNTIKTYLLEAKKIADDTGNFENKEACLLGLNHLYLKNKDYKSNVEVLSEHLALKDSLFSKERTTAIADWETKYETAEKEKEITKLEAGKEKSAARIRFWSIVSILLFLIIGIGSYLFIQLQKVRRKLVLQNDQLTELNQTKDRFFGIIAHDIRSPIIALESVDEQMDYFLKKEDTVKLTALGGLVGKTARHLNSLLDNLLNWALIQTNSIPYHPEKINVLQAWNEIAELMQANVQLKNISFVTNIPSDLEVYADVSSFSTILRNLISNAIKFSNRNSEISILALKNNGNVHVEIQDQGVGMSVEKVSKLFSLEKKSQQGTAGERGTGLGLILCKDLVELNKGTIYVKSKEGEGSTFSFAIPSN